MRLSGGVWDPAGTFAVKEVDIKIESAWKNHIRPKSQAGNPY